MARYEHLPIYKAAFDLAVHVEKIVRHFSRYHKYTLGAELREQSREVIARIIAANDSAERGALLEELRLELEGLKVTARLCQETGAFASVRSYLFVAGQLVGISRQNEGWIAYTARRAAARAAAAERAAKEGSRQNRAS